MESKIGKKGTKSGKTGGMGGGQNKSFNITSQNRRLSEFMKEESKEDNEVDKNDMSRLLMKIGDYLDDIDSEE